MHSIASIEPRSSKQLCVDARNVPAGATDEVNLMLTASTAGTFKLNFSNLASLGSNISIILLDRETGVRTPVTEGMRYTFQLGSSAFAGTNRFALLINNNGVTGLKGLGANTTFGLYPNPANIDGFNVLVTGVEDTQLNVNVMDASGKLVHTEVVPVTAGEVNTKIVANLSAGVYQVQIAGKNGIATRKLVIQ